MSFSKKDLLLYAVTDRSWLGGATLYDKWKKKKSGANGAKYDDLSDDVYAKLGITSGMTRNTVP